MKKTLLPVLLIAVMALVVAGCGDDDNSDSGTPAPAESTETGSGDSSGGKDSGGTGGNTVAVEMAEYSFSPDPIVLKEGDTIDLSNIGGVTHDLTIEAEGVDADVSPGDSTELPIDLKPGSYDVICDIGNHAQLGMVTTLTVK